MLFMGGQADDYQPVLVQRQFADGRPYSGAVACPVVLPDSTSQHFYAVDFASFQPVARCSTQSAILKSACNSIYIRAGFTSADTVYVCLKT